MSASRSGPAPSAVTPGKPVAEPVRTAFKREAALFSSRRYEQAFALLGALLGRPDLTPRQRFEALCRKAECLEHLYRPAEAVRLLREITRGHPNEPLGFSLLGEFLFQVHDDAEGALRALRRALSLQPKDVDSWWWTGQVHQYGRADLARARRAYGKALEIDPQYAPAFDSLAVVCESEGRWIEALDWRKSHYRRTHQVNDLVAIAELYLRVGNAAAAVKYARTAARRSARSATAWMALAKAAAVLGRPALAQRALKRFTRLAGSGGPVLEARDFAHLESLLARPAAARLVARLPRR